MKALFLILLLNIPPILFSKEENQIFTTQIIYNFNYQTDSLDAHTKSSELAELLVNGSTSVFLTSKKYEQDSIFNLEEFKTGIAYRYGKIDPTILNMEKGK